MCQQCFQFHSFFLSPLNKVDNSNGTVLLLLFFLCRFPVLVSPFGGSRPCSKRDKKIMASITSTVSDWSVCVVLFSISMQKYDSTFLHNVSIDTVSCVGPTSLDTISTTPALDGYVLTTASEQSAATHMSRSFPASLWCFRTTHRND